MSRLDLRSRGRIGPQNLFNTVVGIFLFAAFMNLITRNYYWVFFSFAVFVITPDRKFGLNFSTFCLFVLTISMILFEPERRNSITSLLQCFAFLMAYLIGCGFSSKSNDLQAGSKIIEKCIYLCAAGFFVHYLLNFFSNIDSLERNTVDFWTHDIVNATGQASLACVCVAVSIAALFSKTGLIQKIFAVVALLLVVSYNLILAGRTLLIIMVILFLVATVFRSISLKRNIIKDVLVVSAILTVLVLLYNANVLGAKSTFEDSNFYFRFYEQDASGVAEDPRFEFKLLYLKNFFKYPFGGTHIRTTFAHYAHDLYLDGYDQYGIFALLSILLYIISSIVRLFKLLRHSHVPFHTKQLVLCTYLALNIQFMIEPIMQGTPFLLVAYCFIDGTLSQFLGAQERVGNINDCVIDHSHGE
ncbi:MAG: hypothetical protein E7471_05965 [Ruminococcaceae bacterium]|nr:hypothetical protein [Oscillospiraceae bacterium]